MHKPLVKTPAETGVNLAPIIITVLLLHVQHALLHNHIHVMILLLAPVSAETGVNPALTQITVLLLHAQFVLLQIHIIVTHKARVKA